MFEELSVGELVLGSSRLSYMICVLLESRILPAKDGVGFDSERGGFHENGRLV
jgi:hypothetical protein